MSFSGGETHTFKLEDKISSQSLSLRPPTQAYWLKFVVDDVWEGNKYTDTAITKLLVNLHTQQ